MPRLHELRKNPFPQMMSKSAPFGRQIARHIQRTIGTASMVFHDILPNDMPLDIHVITPNGTAKTASHPFGGEFFTLVTSGVSTLGAASRGQAQSRQVELMISLPTTWPGLNQDGTLDVRIMQDEQYSWPLHRLKRLASMPPKDADVLRMHGCVPQVENAPPLAPETRLRYLLLAPSELHPKSQALMVHDDVQIQFLALWPLYLEEESFMRRHGAEALLSELRRDGVTDLVSPRRLPALMPARHEA